jgi:hypothetical protein
MPQTQEPRRVPFWLRRLLVPSFVDLFFLALLVAAFVRPGGLQALLADGDTGWHIRTGELVLATGSAPSADPFSFSRSGQPWFAWEWLSDTIFAIVHAKLGLAGLATLAALILALSATALFTWMLRREYGLWIALAVSLAAVSASSVHYLARPHVFSILFYTLTLWLMDEDRGSGSARLWLLVPLCALWANLHGAFVVLPATLALAAAIAFLRGRGGAARRYAMVTLACAAASLANPYGWQLHVHIATYLNSSWILNHVQEFQSPNIRSEGMQMFAVLLLAGVALASRAMARRRWLEGILVLVWSFAALRSARHIPLFAIAAAPLVAGELAFGWQRLVAASPAKSAVRVFDDLAREFGRRRHATAWLAAIAAAVLASAGADARTAFPSTRFPVQAVERNTTRLAPGPHMPRILSSDQWADYLIFSLYPRQRVFFDGRSDFYGPSLGADYRVLQSGTRNWRELMDRYGFEMALLPKDWPLSTILDREPGWRMAYQDDVAVLVERVPVRNASAQTGRAEGRP